jgi:hypothetical protein
MIKILPALRIVSPWAHCPVCNSLYFILSCQISLQSLQAWRVCVAHLSLSALLAVFLSHPLTHPFCNQTEVTTQPHLALVTTNPNYDREQPSRHTSRSPYPQPPNHLPSASSLPQRTLPFPFTAIAACCPVMASKSSLLILLSSEISLQKSTLTVEPHLATSTPPPPHIPPRVASIPFFTRSSSLPLT